METSELVAAQDDVDECVRRSLDVDRLSLFSTQVTIEVVDDPQMEVEMDLAKEKDWLPSSSSSPSSTVDWLGGKKLFWPLFWSYTDADSGEDSNSRSGAEETGEEEEEEDYSLDYGSEEPLPSGVGGDWDTHWNEGWDPMQSYYGKVCQVVRSLVRYHSRTTRILGGGGGQKWIIP